MTIDELQVWPGYQDIHDRTMDGALDLGDSVYRVVYFYVPLNIRSITVFGATHEIGATATSCRVGAIRAPASPKPCARCEALKRKVQVLQSILRNR